MTDPNAPRRYRLGAAAGDDLEDILRFTRRRWSAQQASDYLDGIEATFERLADMPLAARERSEFRPPVRIAHFKAHVIVYRVEGDFVLIDRILHARSNWHFILSGD